MPKYRRATRAGNGKNASQTCICERVATQLSRECHALLDQGPIDIPDAAVQSNRVQSIHCGLPASWTRARRHPPSSPSPVASRGGGRVLALLNWTRVQLDLAPAWGEACGMGVHEQISSEADLLTDPSTRGLSNTDGMVRIPGDTFRMGSDKHYPEEAPVHRVTVSDFWIDAHPVTNRQFKEFVNATRHLTFAEIPPDPDDYPGALPHMLFAGSLVFTPPKHRVDLRDWSQWWTFMKGASWRHPYGPGTNIKGLDDHPVVHIAYSDAFAYATWARKNLPTEAEWEFAANGGLEDNEFAWGDEFMPGNRAMANTG